MTGITDDVYDNITVPVPEVNVNGVYLKLLLTRLNSGGFADAIADAMMVNNAMLLERDWKRLCRPLYNYSRAANVNKCR